MTDTNLYDNPQTLDGAYADLDPLLTIAAARYVARHARDADDERDLLEALGVAS